MKKLVILTMVFLMLFASLECTKKLQEYFAIGSGVAVDVDLLRIEDMDASAGDRTKKMLMSSLIAYIYGANRTMSGTLSMGANELSGSNVAFTGGTVTGLTTIDGDRLDIDGIRIDANTISSTNINGAITLDPNGTGDINLTTAGGFVVFTEGDIKIGSTALTSTATELNYVNGATSTIAGLDESLSRVTSVITGDTGITKGGFYECDTSGGTVYLTMPAITADNAGREFLISLKTAGNGLRVVDDGADSGFTMLTGDDTNVSGVQIDMSTEKDFVLLRSSGVVGGYWLIVGGYGVDVP